MNLALFVIVIWSCLTLLSTSLLAEPFIHRAVWKALELQEEERKVTSPNHNNNVTLFVSFQTPNLSSALDPNSLAKALAKTQGPQRLMSPQEYHLKRGQFVYNTLAKHHERTKELLILHEIPFDSDHSLPISNSFLIPQANRQILNQLLQVPGIQEVVTTSGQRINLPKPQSHLLFDRPKSFFQSFLGMEDKNIDNKVGDDLQWNLKKIGVDQVWNTFGEVGRGKGIVYAIADTGTYFKHPNLLDNYIGLRKRDSVTGAPILDHNYAWYDGVRTPIGPLGSVARNSKSSCPVAGIEPCDDQGHGTHVASIAVGTGGIGIAPNARWMACRNMDAGVGAPQAYLACLNFFLAPHDLQGKNPRPELRPHVVGNSYGCPDSEGCSPRALKSAVEALRAAGVFMAVSAGNEGPQCGTVSSPPAVEPAIVAVAATNQRDELARFSSRGPVSIDGISWSKPDVSAPGVQIRAAFPPADYRSLSGTSMAAPHVGGAIALMTAVCPCLERNVEQLQILLQATCVSLKPPMNVDSLCGDDTPDSIPNNYFGYGRIDVAAAIKACQRQCLQQKILFDSE